MVENVIIYTFSIPKPYHSFYEENVRCRLLKMFSRETCKFIILQIKPK